MDADLDKLGPVGATSATKGRARLDLLGILCRVSVDPQET